MTEWVPEDQTVNQTYYLKVLATLRERVRKKQLELWKKKLWILHQKSAPAHNVLSVKHYLAAKGIPLLKHMPYSPDLASCHFFLFPKIKSAFKRNPVRVDGRGEVKIGGAPKCSYKRRLAALLWTVEKEWNGVWRGERSTLKKIIRS